jgi:hypothetical protein
MATNPDVLNSWKEVAAYLGRGVRTVQRWERELSLPVRRPRGKSRSAVIAFKTELDRWLRQTGADDELLAEASVPLPVPRAPNGHHKLRESTTLLIGHTNQLLSRSTYLCERSKQLCEQVNRAVALTASFLVKSRSNGGVSNTNLEIMRKDRALAS